MIDNFCVKNCWGNFSFEFVCGPFVGNSGGTLCAWDPRMFHKHNSTISNYFVAIQGDWIPSAKRYLIISVYDPQEAFVKRMLWSYLNHVIERWNGETILMGDFNEVRYKEERFGTIYNNHNALAFNSFISSSGLEDVRLRGATSLVPNRLWVRDKKESASMKKSQLKEATEIAQKVKINWSIEGNENSKFFHGMLNKKRNQHAISGILSEGNWIEDPNSVKNEILSHFNERFDSPCSSRLILDGEFLNKLSADQNLDLERNVTNEEIKRAMWDCGTNKSPRPDGFTFGFYRRYWDTIKKDVEAVSYFFTSGTFPKGGNAYFIALNPKMQDAKVVKYYRPISLIGSLYKIIVKILANRLVGVLKDLVNKVQSAFIVNRQILDGPFILDELIHWCNSKKKETMIF
nr:RNA-directed DNA polymerase, eukaryota, reverse transcriptase zinc-binding domain protein [Tanacetum cinerariifolium]